MPLASGTKLGPYEIQSSLGAGGMGEVYSARDTRLDRTVAIKILPEHLSEKPEAHARFEREARAISSLNHPNICQLYDVGEQNGVRYIVMEYLQGETLADRLKKGPLPLEQLTHVGAEIGDGLQSAHRNGIVHRDLKPGNIMLTKGGAKVLDFGLAKAGAVAGSAHDLMVTLSSPALSDPLTAEGSLVGTFQYMAPEQVEGKEATASSDIFSFGSVLYEMATGKRAFEGKSQISVASSILEKDPPPVVTIIPTAPPALDHVIRGCLAKDSDARWHSAGDVARELRWIATSSASTSQSGTIAATPLPVGRRIRERAAWAVLSAVLLGVVLYFALRPLPATPVIHSSSSRRPAAFSISTATSPARRFSPPTARKSHTARTAQKNAVPFGFSLSIRAHPESSSAPTAEPSPFGRLRCIHRIFLRRQTKNHSCRRRTHHDDRRHTKFPRRRMGRRQRHRLHS